MWQLENMLHLSTKVPLKSKLESSSAIVILQYFLTVLRGGEHNGGFIASRTVEFISGSRRKRYARNGHNSGRHYDGTGNTVSAGSEKGKRNAFSSSRARGRNETIRPRGETAVRAALSRAKSLYRTHLTCLTMQLPSLLRAPSAHQWFISRVT